MKAISTPEITKTGLRIRECQASPHSERGSDSVATASTARSGTSSAGATKCSLPGRASGLGDIADPRVEKGVQDVDDQVRDHEYCHQQRHDRDDLGVLAGTDGIPQVEADPGDVEDGLRDDGASHEHPQVDAD